MFFKSFFKTKNLGFLKPNSTVLLCVDLWLWNSRRCENVSLSGRQMTSSWRRSPRYCTVCARCVITTCQSPDCRLTGQHARRITSIPPRSVGVIIDYVNKTRGKDQKKGEGKGSTLIRVGRMLVYLSISPSVWEVCDAQRSRCDTPPIGLPNQALYPHHRRTH